MRQNTDELLAGIAVSIRAMIDGAIDRGLIRNREDAVSLLLSSAFSIAIERANNGQEASALKAVRTTALAIEQDYAARIEAGEISARRGSGFQRGRR